LRCDRESEAFVVLVESARREENEDPGVDPLEAGLTEMAVDAVAMSPDGVIFRRERVAAAPNIHVRRIRKRREQNMQETLPLQVFSDALGRARKVRVRSGAPDEVKEPLLNAEARFRVRVCEEAEARGGRRFAFERTVLENGT